MITELSCIFRDFRVSVHRLSSVHLPEQLEVADGSIGSVEHLARNFL